MIKSIGKVIEMYTFILFIVTTRTYIRKQKRVDVVNEFCYQKISFRHVLLVLYIFREIRIKTDVIRLYVSIMLYQKRWRLKNG